MHSQTLNLCTPAKETLLLRLDKSLVKEKYLESVRNAYSRCGDSCWDKGDKFQNDMIVRMQQRSSFAESLQLGVWFQIFYVMKFAGHDCPTC